MQHQCWIAGWHASQDWPEYKPRLLPELVIEAHPCPRTLQITGMHSGMHTMLHSLPYNKCKQLGLSFSKYYCRWNFEFKILLIVNCEFYTRHNHNNCRKKNFLRNECDHTPFSQTCMLTIVNTKSHACLIHLHACMCT